MECKRIHKLIEWFDDATVHCPLCKEMFENHNLRKEVNIWRSIAESNKEKLDDTKQGY